MIERAEVPWQLVEADSKRYARVKVIETVCAAMELSGSGGAPVAPPA
jgi:polyphosphate kinase 2 (PPK2 family)